LRCEQTLARWRKHPPCGYKNAAPGHDLTKKQNKLAHFAYVVTIAVKGIDGGIETLLGLTIWLSGPARWYAFLLHFSAPELLEEPGNHRFIEVLRNGASNLLHSPVSFIVAYLVIHGVLKLALALVLLRGGGRWIFPVATAILLAFISFMSWHLSEHWSNWVLGFALFDFITLLLVLNEWRQPPRLRPPL
jgi:uncharacterized membrane protein